VLKKVYSIKGIGWQRYKIISFTVVKNKLFYKKNIYKNFPKGKTFENQKIKKFSQKRKALKYPQALKHRKTPPVLHTTPAKKTYAQRTHAQQTFEKYKRSLPQRMVSSTTRQQSHSKNLRCQGRIFTISTAHGA